MSLNDQMKFPACPACKEPDKVYLGADSWHCWRCNTSFIPDPPANQPARVMTIEELRSFPAGENPFLHDVSRMGTVLGTNVIVMFEQFQTRHQDYLVICDVTTGERIRIQLAPAQKGPQTCIA